MIIDGCSNQLNGSNNEDGYIEVFNQGTFLACFIILYNLNGQQFETCSPQFPPGENARINIPAKADEVTLIVKISCPYQLWTIAYSELFAGVPKKCFKLSGITSNPVCTEIQCPTGDNGSGNPTPPCCCCCCCCK